MHSHLLHPLWVISHIIVVIVVYVGVVGADVEEGSGLKAPAHVLIKHAKVRLTQPFIVMVFLWQLKVVSLLAPRVVTR